MKCELPLTENTTEMANIVEQIYWKTLVYWSFETPWRQEETVAAKESSLFLHTESISVWKDINYVTNRNMKIYYLYIQIYVTIIYQFCFICFPAVMIFYE